MQGNGRPPIQLQCRTEHQNVLPINCIQLTTVYLHLFHRHIRASYVCNGCLAWYNVVLTPRVHSSVKFVGLLLGTRAMVEKCVIQLSIVVLVRLHSLIPL